MYDRQYMSRNMLTQRLEAANKWTARTLVIYTWKSVGHTQADNARDAVSLRSRKKGML